MAKALAKGSRITGAQRTTLASQYAKRYAAGESIRKIADDAGRSFGFVHGVLKEAGVELRGRGGATRGAKKAASSSAARKTTAASARKTAAKKAPAKKTTAKTAAKKHRPRRHPRRRPPPRRLRRRRHRPRRQRRRRPPPRRLRRRRHRPRRHPRRRPPPKATPGRLIATQTGGCRASGCRRALTSVRGPASSSRSVKRGGCRLIAGASPDTCRRRSGPTS